MDLSEVAPGVFVGSLFYPVEEVPGVLIDCRVLRDDDSDQGEAIEGLAELGLSWVVSGFGVVLLCQAGRNRSALVAARLLMMNGMSAVDAIRAVREARADTLARSGGALTNSAFVNYLLAS